MATIEGDNGVYWFVVNSNGSMWMTDASKIPHRDDERDGWIYEGFANIGWINVSDRKWVNKTLRSRTYNDPPIQITLENNELVDLVDENPDFFWYAVDKNGKAYIYKDKPSREGDIYVCNGHYLIIPEDQLIPGITFESDPIKVSINITLFRLNDLPKEDESINEEEFFY